MSSREKSIPAQPVTAASSSFRQTLLWRLENPAYANALETLGQLLWDFVNEGGQFGPEKPQSEPLTVSELRAAAGELRYAAGYLQDLANERTFCDLKPRERKLSKRAEAWARQTATIAASIEEAIRA